MTLPSLLLGVILSTLYGAVFHLWQGGGASRMLFYLVAGWVGFAVGHVAGGWFGVRLGAIGPLNVGTATLSSLLVLFLTRWLLASDAFARDESE